MTGGAQPDLITMTWAQIGVLDRMEDNLGYPFRDIAADTGLSEGEVRGIVHSFHRRGMTGFGVLYDQDGGGVRGRGYWLSQIGYNLQRQMRRLVGMKALWAMQDSPSRFSPPTPANKERDDG